MVLDFVPMREHAKLPIRSNPSRFWPVLGAAILGFLIGCGDSNRASVSGSITLDGKPLAIGVISFVPTGETKGPTAGSTIVDGRYQIIADKGVVVGANRISISSKQKTGFKINRFGPPGSSTAGMVDELADVVPSQYNVKTTLVRDIKSGTNEFNFELQGRVPIESIRGGAVGVR